MMDIQLDWLHGVLWLAGIPIAATVYQRIEADHPEIALRSGRLSALDKIAMRVMWPVYGMMLVGGFIWLIVRASASMYRQARARQKPR